MKIKLVIKTSILFIIFATTGFSSLAQSSAEKFTKRINTHQKGVEKIEKRDKNIDKSKVDVVFVGSSTITKWVNFSLDFDTTKVLNNGFGGSRMSDLLVFFDRVVTNYNPKQIFVYEGDNDLNGGVSVDEFIGDVKAFARLVEVKLPGTKLFILSPKPSPSRISKAPIYTAANERLAELAKKSSFITYIDVTKVMFDANGTVRKDIFKPDMLHMNRKGYELWAPIIKPFVKTTP